MGVIISDSLVSPTLGSPFAVKKLDTENHRLFGLDVLRTIAIFFVLFHHAGGSVATWSEYLSPLRTFGYFGVELFFVLSGFLIGGILIRKVLSDGAFSFAEVRRFWIRRWLRTLPNYYLFLGVYFLVYTVQGVLIPHPFAYLIFMQNLTREAGWFFNGSWSLAVEEWFYLLTPVGCYISLKIFKRASAILIPVAILLILPMLLRAFHFNGGYWSEYRRVVLYRLDALMYGVLAAYLSLKAPNFWEVLKKKGFPIGLAFFVLVMFGLLRKQGGEGLWFSTFVYSLTSLSFALMLPWFAGLRSPRRSFEVVFGFFSHCSYSAYLVHPELQIPFNTLWNHFFPGPFFLFPKFLVWMLLVWSLSYLVFQFFEKPFMNLRERLT